LDSIAVYVHTPFCPSKCGYCDFNSYAMSGEIVERTTAATIREVLSSPLRGVPAKTIFLGGGTPTFLSGDQLHRILDAIREVHPPVEGCEITSEANPGTVDIPKFAAMRSAGFNRISLGAQSFVDDDLIRLDRVHKAAEIDRAVGAAREVGLDNLNLDLMFALPGQSMQGWARNLDKALSLEPDHLSLYCLTIEPNTAFYRQLQRGQLDLPEDEAQVAMYDRCVEQTSALGFEQYEISNFAKPGRECQHNLCYWESEPYAGYGPGAVGAIPGGAFSALNGKFEDATRVRYTNLKHPERYCSAVEEGKVLAFEAEPLEPDTLRLERIMLGIRLNRGVAMSALRIDGIELNDKALRKVFDMGWIEPFEERLVLTPAGRHFCSEVALELA